MSRLYHLALFAVRAIAQASRLIPRALAAPAVALVALCALFFAAPAPAFDPSHDYEIQPGYPQYPLHGASSFGLVIWNPSYKAIDEPMPIALMGLAAHNWDVVKLLRNPDKEGAWFITLPKHMGYLLQQVGNAAQTGYARVILAGQYVGGAMALEAADQVPVYGVIALAPSIGINQYSPAENVVQRTLSALQNSKAARTVLVMPQDDEMLPGINQSPNVRAAMNARGAPYVLIDTQVHGHFGGFSQQMLPYAACAVWFFAPPFAPHAGEFHCHHDEVVPVMQSLNMNPGNANLIWMGYLDRSGQPIVIAEHRAANGSTVDIGLGNNVSGQSKGQMLAGLPAAWSGNMLAIYPSKDDVLTLQPNAAGGIWSVAAQKHSTGGDWAGTLTLVFHK